MTIFNQNTKNLLKRLHQFKEGEVFDAFDVLKHYSMEMICGNNFYECFFLN